MAQICGLSKGTIFQYIAALAASLSVLTSGSCYGWITPILTHLLGPDSEIPISSAEAPWVISIIEVGNFISPLPSGLLADHFGRKPIILATGPLYIISWLMILYWPTALMLAIARTLQGLSMGLAFTIVPIYLGEIASNNNRGAITSLFFNAWWVGFLIEFSVGPFLHFSTFTYFTLSINFPFLLLFIWVPESPYYYLLNGNDEKAEESLKWLRRDTDPSKIKEELEEMKEDVMAGSSQPKMTDVISTPADRKALCLLLTLTAVRLLSGNGALLVYATEIFDLTPNLTVSPDSLTILFGLVMMLGGITCSLMSDTFGRRPLLMVSCIGSIFCQFCAGTYYYFLFETEVVVSTFSWMAPSLILIYSFLCSAGMYPVTSAYTSELFNSNTRGVASSLAAMNVTLSSFVVLLCYQPVTDYVGLYANFYIYALITVFGSIYFYYTAPETKGKSFAEIRKALLKIDVVGETTRI